MAMRKPKSMGSKHNGNTITEWLSFINGKKGRRLADKLAATPPKPETETKPIGKYHPGPICKRGVLGYGYDQHGRICVKCPSCTYKKYVYR